MKSLIHEALWLGREGPFEPHAVAAVRLKRTVRYTMQPKLTWNVDVLNLAANRELSSLVTFGLWFTSAQTAGPHWLAAAVHPVEIPRAVFGTDGLKPML